MVLDDDWLTAEERGALEESFAVIMHEHMLAAGELCTYLADSEVPVRTVTVTAGQAVVSFSDRTDIVLTGVSESAFALAKFVHMDWTATVTGLRTEYPPALEVTVTNRLPKPPVELKLSIPFDIVTFR